jgi:hypothetical protein
MTLRRMTKARLLAAVPEQSEQVFQSGVLEYAGLQGWRAMHIADSRRQVTRGGKTQWIGDGLAAGWPDLTLVRERLIVAELKAESGRLSVKQREWIDALKWAGVETDCWKPSDWEDIQRILGPEPEPTRRVA